MPTAYEVLGVAEDAPAEEIDRAYRAAVRRHHPDRGGSAWDLDLAVRAGHVLRDPASRAAYDDRLRRTRRREDGPRPPRRAPARGITAEDVLSALRLAGDMIEQIRKIRGK